MEARRRIVYRELGATDDSSKDPKTAELPRSVGLIAYVKYGLIAQKEERYVNESDRAEKTGAK